MNVKYLKQTCFVVLFARSWRFIEKPASLHTAYVHTAFHIQHRLWLFMAFVNFELSYNLRQKDNYFTRFNLYEMLARKRLWIMYSLKCQFSSDFNCIPLNAYACAISKIYSRSRSQHTTCLWKNNVWGNSKILLAITNRLLSLYMNTIWSKKDGKKHNYLPHKSKHESNLNWLKPHLYYFINNNNSLSISKAFCFKLKATVVYLC